MRRSVLSLMLIITFVCPQSARSDGEEDVKLPEVFYQQEAYPTFNPDPSYLKYPNHVQFSYYLYKRIDDFKVSQFAPFLELVPEIQDPKAEILVAKLISVVNKPSTIFADPKNYTDAKIAQLFPTAKPKRIPGTNEFACETKTGYRFLAFAGIPSEVHFRASFSRYVNNQSKTLPPAAQVFSDLELNADKQMPTSYVFQPGTQFDFLMESSLSAYVFSPCRPETCGPLPKETHTLVTSYQVFIIKSEQPALVRGETLFTTDGLGGTMVENLRAAIPLLLHNFYKLDQETAPTQ